jgi:hypothetical protein
MKDNLMLYCPFIDKPCVGESCAVFCQQFGRCAVKMMALKMFPKDVKIEPPEINYKDYDFYC